MLPALTEEGVRNQLEWLASAPALLSPAPYHDAGQLLRTVAEEEPALLRTAARAVASMPRPRRLGVYFEQLVAALLNASARFTLVTHNFAIRDGGKTLGELDMLVYDHQRDRLMHWELALKFYLGTSEHWLGPDARDTLEKKTRHLFDQQLPRSELHQARTLLAHYGWNVQEQALLTRGRLFYGRERPPYAPPLCPHHERGWWLRVDALPAGHWLPLERHQWPNPSMWDNGAIFIDSPALLHYIEAQNRPVMVVQKGHPEPGFITPRHWPH